jgi:hypothetical protein
MSLKIDDPFAPGYIEDYDFFEFHRKKRLADIDKIALECERRRRISLKNKALGWRDSGTQAISRLNLAVAGMKSMLQPHNNTKKNASQFKELMKQLVFATPQQLHLPVMHLCPFSTRVLQVTRGDSYKHLRWFANKARLIEWKFVLMKEVRSHYKFTHPFQYEFRPEPSKVRVLRHVFRLQMNAIPLDLRITEELKKKRAHHKVLLAKLKLIRDTMTKCENILICKSRQHTNPKGCSNCGVVYMGGMLGGGTQYVHSCSRETGISTLVTLEFEMESLRQEDDAQVELLDNFEMDLQAFENVVLGIVRDRIQAWWPVVLAWKKQKRFEPRIERSLLRFRRRRLSHLKRDIDVLIKEPRPLDLDSLGEVYCDVLPELHEYATLQMHLKHERVTKWAKLMRAKLTTLVSRTRDRKYREYLRLMAVPLPPRPIVIKSAPVSEQGTFVCYRLECKMRKFLTKERLEIHQKMHLKYDSVRYEKYAADRAAKSVRDAREKQVLGRISGSRQRIGDAADAESEGLLQGLSLHSAPETPAGSEAAASSRQFSFSPKSGSNSARHSTYSFNEAEDEEEEEGEKVLLLLNRSKNVVDQTPLSTSTTAAAAEIGTSLASVTSAPSAPSTPLSNNHECLTKSMDVLGDNVLVADTPSNCVGFARRKSFSKSHETPASPLFPPYTLSSQLATLASASVGTEVIHISDAEGKELASRAVPKNRYLMLGRAGKVLDRFVRHPESDVNYQSRLQVAQWADMRHIHSLNNLSNAYLYSLELVSKQGDVAVAQRVPLDKPVVRIGTHPSCECVVALSGAAKREAKISTVHCLLYCPMFEGSSVIHASGSSSSSSSSGRSGGNSTNTTAAADVAVGVSPGGRGGVGSTATMHIADEGLHDAPNTDTDAGRGARVTLVDNGSVWGCYLVTCEHTRRVPTKITAGLALTPGALVCIGVCKDGGAGQISATQASQACVVYRVRCIERELR